MILNSLSHRGTPPANVTLRQADTRASRGDGSHNFIGLDSPSAILTCSCRIVSRSFVDVRLANRALSPSAWIVFFLAFLAKERKKGRANDKRTPDGINLVSGFTRDDVCR